MALTYYQTLLQNLIQAPNSPVPLLPVGLQTDFINIARNQLAADAECIRVPGTLTVPALTASMPFSAISVPGGVGNGDVITVRAATWNPSSQPLDIRPWEWFQQYYFSNLTAGVPTVIAQQGQGTLGTLFFYLIPNPGGVVFLDVCCLPIPLVDDTTPEAIPPLWQDAVSYYAGWLAMQSLQRQADAEIMYQRYQRLAQRGRQTATPSELPDNMPGGVGAAIASTKMTLAGTSPQARGGQR